MIVASSNAYNLIDGIDGLAVSQGMIIVCFLGTVALMQGDFQLVEIATALMIMLIGFFWVNWHPAKLFMGDVGSLSVGAMLATFAILLKVEIIFGILSSVLVFETISVIIQVVFFKLGYGRVFKMAPFHHHLELSGWSEYLIVSVFAMITMIMVCMCGFLYAI